MIFLKNCSHCSHFILKIQVVHGTTCTIARSAPGQNVSTCDPLMNRPALNGGLSYVRGTAFRCIPLAGCIVDFPQLHESDKFCNKLISIDE